MSTSFKGYTFSIDQFVYDCVIFDVLTNYYVKSDRYDMATMIKSVGMMTLFIGDYFYL